MTIDELKTELQEILDNQNEITGKLQDGSVSKYDHMSDPANNHILADEYLLDYIGDDDARKLFEAIDKWYS